jgi:hypothetical protein
MTKMISSLIACLTIAGLTATPAAAVITTFSTFSAVSGANLRFVNSGNSSVRTTDATVYTISTPAANAPGSVLVNFSFLLPQLAPFATNISALYTLNGQIAKNSPATPTTGAFTQPGLSGTFSFLSTSAILVSGAGYTTTLYGAGSNLLSGSFSNGSYLGTIGGSAAGSSASGVNGTTISFTSDFLDFTNVVNLDRAVSLTAITPRLTARTGVNKALATFKAVTSGQFSSDPAPIVIAVSQIPEPASWAMLMLGFGLVGGTMRRRARTVIA